MYCVHVESIFFGKKDSLDDLSPVEVTFATEQIPLKELIAQAVMAQVDSLEQQQQSDDARRKRFQRQYLSAEDIEQQAKEGRIGLNENKVLQLDRDACIRHALAGFRNGRYFIAVNGSRPTTLEDQIILMPNSKVQFVRLVPLVGG
ncbi:hypothetical protein R50072_11760 [Simiduia litorea]|uniref:hypothetical protein n=1 Tax=Simiduia litorea TaxID=1435348 RepID=UPI0036F1C0B4